MPRVAMGMGPARAVAVVTAHDQGFVAAPPATVYGMLVDVARYPEWWLGTRTHGSPGDLRLRLPSAPPVLVTAEGHRPDVGVFLRLGPPLGGTLEWYLESFEEGSIVNSILDVRLPGGARGSRRRLRRIRAGIRRGLVGLREELG